MLLGTSSQQLFLVLISQLFFSLYFAAFDTCGPCPKPLRHLLIRLVNGDSCNLSEKLALCTVCTVCICMYIYICMYVVCM